MPLLTNGKPMTDEEALKTLEGMKMSMTRGAGKTLFQSVFTEAMSRACAALKEKVDGKPPHADKKEFDTDSIKPCPHCGRMPSVGVEINYNIHCSMNNCNMPFQIKHNDLNKAIKSWNTLSDQIKGENDENN